MPHSGRSAQFALPGSPTRASRAWQPPGPHAVRAAVHGWPSSKLIKLPSEARPTLQWKRKIGSNFASSVSPPSESPASAGLFAIAERSRAGRFHLCLRRCRSREHGSCQCSRLQQGLAGLTPERGNFNDCAVDGVLRRHRRRAKRAFVFCEAPPASGARISSPPSRNISAMPRTRSR
jgi:hypothetical protein